MGDFKAEELKSPHGGDQKSLVKFAFSLLLEIDARSDIFHQYLQFEMAGENLEFRREVFAFKNPNANVKHKKKTAKAIYDEFVKENAPRMINISANCRSNIASKIGNADLNVFDGAVVEVDLMLTQGPFPRFANKISDTVEDTWRKVTEKMSASEVGKIL
jgi:hypothetical protein